MEQRYAPLLPLLLFASAPFAQVPFEFADQRTHNTRYSAADAQSNGWTIGGSAGSENGIFTYGFITHLSGNGDTLWTIQPSGAEFSNGFPSVLARTQDDHVLAAGDVDGCDTGPFDQGFLMSIAPDGAVDWERRTFFNGVRDIAQAPNGQIAALGYQELEIRSAAGDSLHRSQVLGEQVFWLSDTVLLVCGVTNVYRMASNGDEIGSTGLPWGALRYGHRNGQLLAIRFDGYLFALDETSLAVLDSVPLSDTFIHSAVLRMGNTWRVIGEQFVFDLDDSLSVTNSFSWDPDEEFPEDLFRIFVSDGESQIAMAGNPLLANRTTGLVRVIGADGSVAVHPTNVAIEVASMDSTWYTGTLPIIFPHATVSIRVTNQATEILEDLVLNSWINAGICSAPGNTYRYHALGLAQGEDTVLTGIQPLLWYGPFASVDSQYFCIAALSPNDRYDRDQSDNLACDTVKIVLGLEDHAVGTNGLFIANPFSGALNVVFITPSQEPIRATLFDATGRRLTATTIAAGSTRFHWDLPGLGNGVHILHLEDHSSTTIRKLVHQEP